LKTDLGAGARSTASAFKMAGKKIIGLRPIEAVWCTPHDYETSDPLKPNWYEPQAWFAMSKQIHASRLLKIIPHPVSDLLKPAYSFGGVPLIQMAEPYVENYLKVRQSVSDLIQSFSQWVLATNLDATLAGGTGDDVYSRAAIFNNAKQSRGMMIIDKEKEEFKNVQTPLGGWMSCKLSPWNTSARPFGSQWSKYTGIDPQGLNASSEGSIRVYYDLVHSTQEYLIKPPLQTVVDLVHIELFGDVDQDILFSPQQDWSQNVYFADQVLDIYHEQGQHQWDADMGTTAKKIWTTKEQKALLGLIQGKKLDDLDNPAQRRCGSGRTTRRTRTARSTRCCRAEK
jgi:uncharacterized protein